MKFTDFIVDLTLSMIYVVTYTNLYIYHKSVIQFKTVITWEIEI